MLFCGFQGFRALLGHFCCYGSFGGRLLGFCGGFYWRFDSRRCLNGFSRRRGCCCSSLCFALATTHFAWVVWRTATAWQRQGRCFGSCYRFGGGRFDHDWSRCFDYRLGFLGDGRGFDRSLDSWGDFHDWSSTRFNGFYRRSRLFGNWRDVGYSGFYDCRCGFYRCGFNCGGSLCSDLGSGYRCFDSNGSAFGLRVGLCFDFGADVAGGYVCNNDLARCQFCTRLFSGFFAALNDVAIGITLTFATVATATLTA